MTDSREEELRRDLHALGFDAVRFAPVAPAVAGGLRAWLDAGMQADMHWMERSAEKRLDPQLVLPGAQAMILLGVSYASDGPTEAGPQASDAPTAAAARPRWARYALHDDYHDTIKPALIAAGKLLESRFGVGGGDYRYYVDTGPVLERGWAERAGLGFTGKNAMLISRTHGNWLCLAAILTRVPLVPDAPLRPDADARVGLLCGKCTRCLDACPTRAFAAPGVVDARRCVSYQTIENKGIIPRELRAGIGARIYGCDVCAEVCPWNRFAQAGRRMLLKARGEIADLSLPDLLALTPERFAEAFRRTPIKRVKLGGLLRNTCIVAGNSGDATLLPALVRLASHELALVRAHAVWAVYQLAGATQAAALLAVARGAEADPSVLAEYAAETVEGDGGCAPDSPS